MDDKKLLERTDVVIELEKSLLKTSWVEESKRILKYVPEENITKKDKLLFERCIEKKDFTDKQFEDLKKALAKYREPLQKIKPEDSEKAIDDTVRIIKTEQEFLDLMDDEKDKYLIVHLPTRKGVMEFEFEVLPLIDSRVVESLELQVDLFRDYSLEETAMYASAVNKLEEDRTSEEIAIINQMNKSLNDKISKQRIQAVDNFLAHQLKIRDSDTPIDGRLKFWSMFHFNAKFSIFIMVQKRLGLTEINNRELFPFGG